MNCEQQCGSEIWMIAVKFLHSTDGRSLLLLLLIGSLPRCDAPFYRCLDSMADPHYMHPPPSGIDRSSAADEGGRGCNAAEENQPPQLDSFSDLTLAAQQKLFSSTNPVRLFAEVICVYEMLLGLEKGRTR